MYVAVLAIIMGQGFMLGNVRVLGYGGFIWLGFHLFVLAYGELTLRTSTSYR